jgi:hypothetical protein
MHSREHTCPSDKRSPPTPELSCIESLARLTRCGSPHFRLTSTPSVQPVHDYYPCALEDGGRLAPTAAELVVRLAILVAVRRFHGMGAVDSRSLRFDSFVRMQHFFRRYTYIPIRRFGERLAARIRATSFYCYAWDFGFLPLKEGSADAVACLPVPRA